MGLISFSPDLDFMDLIGQDRQWTVGRKLMQVNDTLTSEDTGLRSSKNCTEPGKTRLRGGFALGAVSLAVAEPEPDAVSFP